MMVKIKTNLLLLLLNATLATEAMASSSPIDRHALVTRHNVTLRQADPLTPLSVGNGEFAFTADITGLQTFPGYHETGMPLGTQSQWAWHTLSNPRDPMLAMTAARLGETDRAIDALFMDSPKNRYLANGHNYQSARLPLYLPGNGGLLTAVAMMAAGWEGCPEQALPGFPKDGKWHVRWEGLKPMP